MASDKDHLEQAEPNTLKDRWGNERPYDASKYPDDSAAHEGHITKPSGQGGATPKSRPDHQDMFPKNPEPSAGTKEYGDRLRKIEQGEQVDLAAPLESVKADAGKADGKSESASDRQARTERVASKDSPK